MAAGPYTKLSDVIIPEVFTPYMFVETETRDNLIQSGAVARDELLDNFLAGAGLTVEVPSYADFDDDDNVSTDDTPDDIALSASGAVPALPASFNDVQPFKITTQQETAVRLSRNGSWARARLARSLIGNDPMSAIASRVADWWGRRRQKIFIATWQGVSRDNAANDSGDYALDNASTAYQEGVTDFSAEAIIDARTLLGDRGEDLSILMVHSTVYARMAKNNLIDFQQDSVTGFIIPTFQGMRVVKNDLMPSGTSAVRGDGSAGASGIYESWLFAPGATLLGMRAPPESTEVERKPAAGNGGGGDVLYSRLEMVMHPVGHAYTGTAPNGGPGNGTGSNNLNNAGSWNRVYAERKKIKFARLITREA